MILLPNQLFFAEVEAMLAEGREVQIRMKGHSMRPLLRSERDRVVLAPCTDPARLQPGDVVLFRCSADSPSSTASSAATASASRSRATETTASRNSARRATSSALSYGLSAPRAAPSAATPPAGGSGRASGSRSRPGCGGRCCACSGIRAGNEKSRALKALLFRRDVFGVPGNSGWMCRTPCVSDFKRPCFVHREKNPRTGSTGVRPIRGFRGMCGNTRLKSKTYSPSAKRLYATTVASLSALWM